MTSYVKDRSIVNRIMFPAPISSYDESLGVCWVDDTCCLFISYHHKTKSNILTRFSDLETHPVIVLCHGNGCDIGNMVAFANQLSTDCECHVVLYEYPGYGLSPGFPSENSCATSLVKVIEHLYEKMNIPIENMVFYGQSIGSGVATCGYKYCKTKYDRSPAGLVLISPYLSIKALGNDIIGSSVSCILERFDTRDNIRCCYRNLLIIHGSQDQVIPVEHGIELHKIALETCKNPIISILDGMSHNNIPKQHIIDKCRELTTSINIVCQDYRNSISWIKPVNTYTTKRSSLSTTIASSLEASIGLSTLVTSECVLF